MGNMCINGMKIQRENKPIPTSIQNTLCEDDILQRVKDPHAFVVIWFVGAAGTKLEGRGAYVAIRLDDLRRLPDRQSPAMLSPYYHIFSWHVLSHNMVPLDQLVEKTHADLRLRGGDFGFETLAEFDNASTSRRRLFLNGKRLADVPPGENFGITKEDLEGVGREATVTAVYGKEGGEIEGGISHIYRIGADSKWHTFAPLVVTDADSAWTSKPHNGPVEIENKSGRWKAVVGIGQRALGSIPVGGRYTIPSADLRSPNGAVKVNIVYAAEGKAQGGEFRIYGTRQEGRVEIGQVRVVNPDGTSEAISAPTPPAAPLLSSAWALTPD
jgi:hypothetical protein